MYTLIDNGKTIGFTEKIRYIAYRDAIDAYTEVPSKEEADGIVFGNNIYNFENSNKIPNVPSIHISEKDGMEIVFNNSMKINEMNILLNNVSNAIVDLDNDLTNKYNELKELIEQLRR